MIPITANDGPNKIMEVVEKKYIQIIFLLCLFYIFWGIFYLWMGGINEDEGIYLYAGKLVYQGKTPYSDFLYVQAPLLAYVYGIFQLLAPGLYMGRITSLMFGLLTLLFSMGTAHRLQGKLAAIICGASIVFNPFALYFLTITKTYALTACLISISLYFLVGKMNSGIKYSLSALFLCLATGVRLSILVAIPILLLYVFFSEKENKKYFWLAMAVSGITLGVIFLPFYFRAPDNMLFGMVGFHMDLYGPGSFWSSIYYKIITLRSLSGIFAFMAVFLAAGLVFSLSDNRRNIKNIFLNPSVYLYFTAILVAIFLVHFLPGESHDEYQVINLPLMAILAGSIGYKFYEKIESKNIILYFIGALIVVNFISLAGKGMDVRGGLPLQEITEASDFIKQHTEPHQPIFTYHPYLAVQAKRDLLPGLEMGFFNYRPEWDRKKAQKYHVTNYELAMELIDSKKAAVVVLTDIDFRFNVGNIPWDPIKYEGQRKELITKIQEHYYLAKRMNDFGQWRERIFIFLPKNKNLNIQTTAG